MAKRPPRHKVNHKQRASALSALARIVESPTAAEYVKAKAAASIIFASKIDDGDAPERDDDAPGTMVFMPRKDRLPGQREDETRLEFTDRRKAWVEGRRAVYCEHIGEDYDPARALPCWPWPVPGSDPELEDEADRRADEAEAAEIERQRGNPRPEPVEVLGPQEDAPGVVIFDSTTQEGLADYARWRSEAVAAGHAIIAPQ